MVIYIKKKTAGIVVGFAFILFVGMFLYEAMSNFSVSVSTEISNWGLSFREEGKAPVGNASAKALKEYDAYYVGDDSEKVIYLTFDAGFENGHTSKILDTLKKHDVKATFFLVGHYIEQEPQLVMRMLEEGHIVGNHTFNHPDMSKISDVESFKKELISLEELYKQVTGRDMQKYYRPPQGKFNESNLSMAKELGYKTIFWSLAYVDWYNDKQPTKEHAFSKLLPRIHPGAVVLLHSTSKTNAEILDELLTKWKEDGYIFKNIDSLTAEQ
ncbi:MAG TPA: delta-lactam-biosynthetic de-N-acetylase [Clostridiales bacterium]|nr:delta-lactam-biosynthetic de-N-acetylase [Clostridiales bacterium]